MNTNTYIHILHVGHIIVINHRYRDLTINSHMQHMVNDVMRLFGYVVHMSLKTFCLLHA